tara:strand:- start:387 stop:920 length:534 start_codon:yes stop_codon:yes gene_type:complete
LILGLDISTSITGYAIVDKDDNIILNGAWDFRNKRYFPTLMTKAQKIKDALLDLQTEYQIEQIYIEKSLQSFRSGFSSAKTLSTLSSFNGIVSWLCYDIYGIEPIYLAAPSARRIYGLKIQRGQKAKEVVLQYLVNNEPAFEIEYTRNGNPKPHCYDMADSIVIAKAGYICEQNSKS